LKKSFVGKTPSIEKYDRGRVSILIDQKAAVRPLKTMIPTTLVQESNEQNVELLSSLSEIVQPFKKRSI